MTKQKKKELKAEALEKGYELQFNQHGPEHIDWPYSIDCFPVEGSTKKFKSFDLKNMTPAAVRRIISQL
jgi:hypothetical protein